jgi:very-short-patch-repair endonuclease
MAIECDGDPFHSSSDDVAYDIKRQEFLERVGWKIYRILYSLFRKDAASEMNKLTEFIQQYTK